MCAHHRSPALTIDTRYPMTLGLVPRISESSSLPVLLSSFPSAFATLRRTGTVAALMLQLRVALTSVNKAPLPQQRSLSLSVSSKDVHSHTIVVLTFRIRVALTSVNKAPLPQQRSLSLSVSSKDVHSHTIVVRMPDPPETGKPLIHIFQHPHCPVFLLIMSPDERRDDNYPRRWKP